MTHASACFSRATSRGTIRRRECLGGHRVQVPRLQRVRREQTRVALVEERRPHESKADSPDAERASPIPQYDDLLEAASLPQFGQPFIDVAAVASKWTVASFSVK